MNEDIHPLLRRLMAEAATKRANGGSTLTRDPEAERAIEWLVWSALVDPAAGPHPAFPHRQEVAR